MITFTSEKIHMACLWWFLATNWTIIEKKVFLCCYKRNGVCSWMDIALCVQTLDLQIENSTVFILSDLTLKSFMVITVEQTMSHWDTVESTDIRKRKYWAFHLPFPSYCLHSIPMKTTHMRMIWGPHSYNQRTKLWFNYLPFCKIPFKCSRGIWNAGKKMYPHIQVLVLRASKYNLHVNTLNIWHIKELEKRKMSRIIWVGPNCNHKYFYGIWKEGYLVHSKVIYR